MAKQQDLENLALAQRAKVNGASISRGWMHGSCWSPLGSLEKPHLPLVRIFLYSWSLPPLQERSDYRHSNPVYAWALWLISELFLYLWLPASSKGQRSLAKRKSRLCLIGKERKKRGWKLSRENKSLFSMCFHLAAWETIKRSSRK